MGLILKGLGFRGGYFPTPLFFDPVRAFRVAQQSDIGNGYQTPKSVAVQWLSRRQPVYFADAIPLEYDLH